MKLNILLLVAIFILSCSKTDQKNYTIKEVNGIKTFKNGTKPSQKLNIKPKKIFTINGDNADSLQVLKMPMKVSIDSNNNIYILDVMQSNIKKYDSNGNFIKVISKHGMGPGELTYPNGMVLVKDTIYVTNQPQKKIVKFDREGNYLGDIFIPNGTPQMVQKVGNNRFIGYVSLMNSEEQKLNFNLSILDKKFKVVKELTQKAIKFGDTNINLLDLIYPYTVSDKEIFISSNSNDKYVINVYDFNGKPTYNIEKRYKKLTISEEELNNFNKAMKKAGESNPNSKIKYKKAINDLFVDNQGRLWVRVSVDRSKNNNQNCIIDIFKDGAFLNRVVFDNITGSDFFDPLNLTYIYDNRIYLFNTEDGNLSVYEY
ncbi:MAG: hypothetical protein CR982_08500 [Candidatus Cloacimonadota bacterium]|nr:MAG: hypothetical protein CR982_08500 [Candidatus Cloacimonadota bacterium]PIE78674.1 MAG: hypothetical protein CSA15_06425 [Candidatus Delongbacteria bacterium]